MTTFQIKLATCLFFSCHVSSFCFPIHHDLCGHNLPYKQYHTTRLMYGNRTRRSCLDVRRRRGMIGKMLDWRLVWLKRKRRARCKRVTIDGDGQHECKFVMTDGSVLREGSALRCVLKFMLVPSFRAVRCSYSLVVMLTKRTSNIGTELRWVRVARTIEI
ncbi:hypothetical protein B0H65DRAFT_249998 [Neurospora tetraspora]|uniref:Secreted protein n=1 Tax=Neurospora tetraspora TaxID=94610 RepID=A0AAE0JAI4_9PEZI|nr:hypothetical protein B0H65DRAFT_249998 [Neurospora tetraspora]